MINGRGRGARKRRDEKKGVDLEEKAKRLEEEVEVIEREAVTLEET